MKIYHTRQIVHTKLVSLELFDLIHRLVNNHFQLIVSRDIEYRTDGLIYYSLWVDLPKRYSQSRIRELEQFILGVIACNKVYQQGGEITK